MLLRKSLLVKLDGSSLKNSTLGVAQQKMSDEYRPKYECGEINELKGL